MLIKIKENKLTFADTFLDLDLLRFLLLPLDKLRFRLGGITSVL